MATFDPIGNFGYGIVTVAPSPATSGLTLTLTTGEGALFPVPGVGEAYNVLAYPPDTGPLLSNAEIIRVSGNASDALTFARAQEGTTAKSIAVGWQIAFAPTAKTMTDIFNAINAIVGGTGTVTTVSVTTANGVSGSVANPTTTPAITLLLGAITPSSVNGVVVSGSSTPTLAVTGTTAVSGTNTGDQTSVSGNAGTATALATARNIDGVSFNGTANITVIAPATHAATNKSTPVDADELPLADSAASYVLKHVTWANIKATLKTYFDTLYTTAAAAIAAVKAGFALDANAAIQIKTGLSDGEFSGVTVAGVAGESLAFGDLVYLKTSDSRWWKTDADAAATAGAVKIGMVVTSGLIIATGAITLLQYGNIRADSKFPTFTIGVDVYVSVTGGEVQVAQPSGTDDVIRIVGEANTADELFFNPSNEWMEHT